MSINNNDFIVSVIIPVYNAQKFVERAVSSAISQPETGEICLIEDGSNDGSYIVCKELESKYDKVNLFTHVGHNNLGAGASRNLGIKKAKYDLISFLDADDFFLPNRFKKTIKTFENNPDADGVYEAIGINFESDEAKHLWKNNPKGGKYLTTISEEIEPSRLFWCQEPIGRFGTASLDGLTIKKKSLIEIGLFNTSLRLHQDTDLFMKLAMACSLYPGNIKTPVTLRGVHLNNRITKFRTFEEKFNDLNMLFNSTYDWAIQRGYNAEALEIKKILKSLRISVLTSDIRFANVSNFRIMIKELFKNPLLMVHKSYYMSTLKFTKLLVKRIIQ